VKGRLEKYYTAKKYDKIDKLLGEDRNVDFVYHFAEIAVDDDNLELMKVLFKHDPEEVKKFLYHAVNNERTDIVDFLLLHQADTEDCLSLSCEHENDEIFDRILSVYLAQGKNINEKGFLNPLFTACRHGCISKINKLYLYGADINMVDDDGRNALFHCYYYPDCLELLVNYGIQMIADGNGVYPDELSNCDECLQILGKLRQQL